MRGFYAAYLKAMGKLEEAVAEARRGVEAEPSLILNAVLGRDLYFAGHDDLAIIQQLLKTIELDPSFTDARLFLGCVYERRGMFKEAIAEFREALSLSGGHPRSLSALGHGYAVSGQRKLAEQWLLRLIEQAKERYVPPYDIAVIYAGLKEVESTFKYLEMAYQDRSFWMCWLRIDPRFDAIRGDPRYKDLLRRMHLNP